jgi:hypothetical protein
MINFSWLRFVFFFFFFFFKWCFFRSESVLVFGFLLGFGFVWFEITPLKIFFHSTCLSILFYPSCAKDSSEGLIYIIYIFGWSEIF